MRKENFVEVEIIKNNLKIDERGFSSKYYEKKMNFEVTENLLIESKKGVLRGIHFQTENGQNRMITCLKGKIWLAIVDLRKASSNFGDWCSIELGGEDSGMTSVIIPKEFGIGTYAIEDSLIDYKCEGEYVAGYDGGIVWDDQTLAIEWPIANNQIIVSEKDKSWQSFDEYRKRNDEK